MTHTSSDDDIERLTDNFNGIYNTDDDAESYADDMLLNFVDTYFSDKKHEMVVD